MSITKVCSRCAVAKDLDDYDKSKLGKGGLRSHCKACQAGLIRERNLRKHYNISPADYDDMLVRQAGGCAICHQGCPTGRRLAVDHDHRTGKVRALLCASCNVLLGHAKDSIARLRAATAYLIHHNPEGAPA